MNTNHADVPWLDKKHFENRDNFPMDELAKYAGKYIAWNWAGDTIFESDPDEQQLWHQLAARGIDTKLVVSEFVPDE